MAKIQKKWNPTGPNTQELFGEQVTKRSDGYVARRSVNGQVLTGFGKTPDVAVERLIEKIKLAERGIISSKTPFGIYFSSWLEKKRVEWQLSTQINYSSMFTHHIKPYEIASVPLNQLKEEHFINLRDLLLKTGKSHSVVSLTLHLCKSCLKHAVKKDKHLTQNVAEGVNVAKERKREVKVLNQSEAQNLFKIFASYRYILAILIGIGAGLRRGECLGLRWDDVNFVNSGPDKGKTKLHIKWQWKKNARKPTKEDIACGISSSCGLCRTKGKNGKTSERTVELTPGLANYLKIHQASQAEEIKNKKIIKSRGFVFAREDGYPPHPDTLTKDLKRHLKIAGVKVITFHELRKTCATLAMALGNDPKTVATLLGHTTTRMVNEIYTVTSTKLSSIASSGVQNIITPNLPKANKAVKVFRRFKKIMRQHA